MARNGICLVTWMTAATASARTFHGYRSSEAWLPREPLVVSPLGTEMVAEHELPTDFDWRNVDGQNFVTADINQHVPVYCGSCWIHGVTSTLNDRIKIMRKGRFPDVMLARQTLIDCVPGQDGADPPGCNGGDAWMIHKYMTQRKIPDETCMPYQGINLKCVEENICRNCYHNMTIDADGHPFFTPGPCFGVKEYTGYGVSEYGHLKGEKDMMKEIYARGPIACSAATDDTFVYNYSINEGVLKDDVYTTDVKYTPAQIDHVMEVAGWGVSELGTPYWVVRNSWGTYWGNMGWVKVRRGVDQQLFESGGCDWAVPTFEDVEEQLNPANVVLGTYFGVTWQKRPGVKLEPASKQERLREASAQKLQPLGLAVTAGSDTNLDNTMVVFVFTAGLMVGAAFVLLATKKNSRSAPRLPENILG